MTFAENADIFGTQILILFDSRRAAERRVAGLPAAARIVAEAAQAGGRDIAVEVASGETLSDALWAELGRVAGSARLASAKPAAPSVVLRGSHLVTAPALRRFLAGDDDSLISNGVPVVVRGEATRLGSADTGAHAREARAGEVIALDRPGAARRILLSTGKASDGLISRWVNRPVSRRISALLLHVPGIRPWHMTLATAVTAVLMFACFALGTAGGLVAGGLLFQAASVLDGVDGEIARATHRSSLRGAIFDTSIDIATNFLFYVGLTIGLTRMHGQEQALVGGMTVFVAAGGLLILVRLARGLGKGGSFDMLKLYYRHRCPTGVPRRIVETFITITSRDYFAFAFALLLVAGAGAAVGWILAGFSTLWFVLVLIAAPALAKEKGTGTFHHQVPAE